MDEKEAMSNLQHVISLWEDAENMYSDTMDIEIDQEFIDTIYAAKAALEKQIAKKPICKEDAYTGLVTSYRCPVCGRFFGQAGKRNVILFRKEPYCQGKDCGQKIDWESVEKDRKRE